LYTFWEQNPPNLTFRTDHQNLLLLTDYSQYLG
jgi:hypothetical protein